MAGSILTYKLSNHIRFADDIVDDRLLYKISKDSVEKGLLTVRKNLWLLTIEAAKGNDIRTRVIGMMQV